MYKTTKKDFELFKKECLYLQEKWGLQRYDLHFEHKNLNDDKLDAAASKVSPNYVAYLILDTEIDEPHIERPISKMTKDSARHEMLHILIGRYVLNAWSRFINKNELDESEEELVRTLEKLIKD